MKAGNVERELLRVDEVARRLGCNPETIRRKIHRGELPALRLGDGPRAPLRVDAGELEEWLGRSRPVGAVVESPAVPGGPEEAA